MNYFDHFADIIRAVGGSTTGLVALFALIAGAIALVFFRGHTVPIAVKLLVFLVLVTGFGLFVYKFYNVTPTSGDLISKSDNLATTGQAEPEGDPGYDAVAPASPAPGDGDSLEPEEAQPARRVRVDCGRHWTGWVDVGSRVGSPCPSGCERGQEVGQSLRMVHFPPRPQIKHKFQCWRWEEQ
jgi:hypothetical protein